jgi:hypothetical protein
VPLVSRDSGMSLGAGVPASRTALMEPGSHFFQECFYSCECS